MRRRRPRPRERMCLHRVFSPPFSAEKVFALPRARGSSGHLLLLATPWPERQCPRRRRTPARRARGHHACRATTCGFSIISGKTARRRLADLGHVLPDGRHRWAEQRGEPDVVETDDRRRLPGSARPASRRGFRRRRPSCRWRRRSRSAARRASSSACMPASRSRRRSLLRARIPPAASSPSACELVAVPELRSAPGLRAARPRDRGDALVPEPAQMPHCESAPWRFSDMT